MNTPTVTDWVQIVTATAVLVGLGFVVYELQQSRDIAQAQLISDGFSALVDRRLTSMGERPAASIAKACSSPRDLNGEDFEVLNSYYHNLLTEWVRVGRINQATGLYQDYITPIEASFATILKTPYGKYWWINTRRWYEDAAPDLVRIGNASLERADQLVDCNHWEASYLESLSRDE